MFDLRRFSLHQCRCISEATWILGFSLDDGASIRRFFLHAELRLPKGLWLVSPVLAFSLKQHRDFVIIFVKRKIVFFFIFTGAVFVCVCVCICVSVRVCVFVCVCVSLFMSAQLCLNA